MLASYYSTPSPLLSLHLHFHLIIKLITGFQVDQNQGEHLYKHPALRRIMNNNTLGPGYICGPMISSITSNNSSSSSSTTTTRTSSGGLLVRLAMRISRGAWFSFLRRVFHYQNGSTSHLGSTPFNSPGWMRLELFALVLQICITTTTLILSKDEKPVWPMRIWIVAYDIGCIFNIFMLYARYTQLINSAGQHIQQPHTSADHGVFLHQELRTLEHVTNKCRTSLELLFAIWFVMGNVWVFDSTSLGSLRRSPKLHYLCISLLAWNAIIYSFPFLLFLLLCCFVPLISTLLGYNMNMGSLHKGASDHQISNLPTWNFSTNLHLQQLDEEAPYHHEEQADSDCCCICLAKYRDKEEVRQLPCLHLFHLKCVDQWLRIISCCPLCKQQLER